MNCYSRLLCKDTKEVKKTMKYRILTFTALAGGIVAELFGGWDRALQTLLLFMAMDWITGGILLPGVFGKSPKSPTGALSKRNDIIICPDCSSAGQASGCKLCKRRSLYWIYSK